MRFFTIRPRLQGVRPLRPVDRRACAVLFAPDAHFGEVAEALASGAIERFKADFGIGLTGIAGPDGGTPEKPVGLVWFALALGDGEMETRRLTFPGSRADIRERATVAALGLLWRRLERDVHAPAAVP